MPGSPTITSLPPVASTVPALETENPKLPSVTFPLRVISAVAAVVGILPSP